MIAILVMDHGMNPDVIEAMRLNRFRYYLKALNRLYIVRARQAEYEKTGRWNPPVDDEDEDV